MSAFVLDGIDKVVIARQITENGVVPVPRRDCEAGAFGAIDAGSLGGNLFELSGRDRCKPDQIQQPASPLSSLNMGDTGRCAVCSPLLWRAQTQLRAASSILPEL